ncbi:MAG: FadR/GntR family transcriptional regulator [Candidatus Dormibacteria bacterium]
MNVSVPPLKRGVYSHRETDAADLSQHLIDLLLSGAVAAGAKFPSERELATACGVGRSVVRDALKSLDLLGIVQIRPGDGTYARAVESDLLARVIEWGLLLRRPRVLDLIEARGHLERALAGMAASRRSDNELSELGRLLAGMRAAASSDDFVAADLGFHLMVARAAHNQVLSDVVTGLQSLLTVWMARVLAAAADASVSSYEEHVPIFESIRMGDPESASAAMKTHLDSAASRLISGLSDTDQGGRLDLSHDPARDWSTPT